MHLLGKIELVAYHLNVTKPICIQAFIFITSYASSFPSAFLIIIYAYRTSMHLDICFVASHLGMRDAREGRGVEPNPRRCLLDHPKGGGTEQVLGLEMSTSQCKLTELTLCWILGKPRSISPSVCKYLIML
jgi:hypothetical protein